MNHYLFSTRVKTILDSINGYSKNTHEYWFKANSEVEAIMKFKEMFGDNADYKIIKKVVR